MRPAICAVIAGYVVLTAATPTAQPATRTLVAVLAHADDEGPAAPVLARYAREGVRVHLIVATDGSQGAANTSVPRGPEIAKLRAEEMRCSAQAIGAEPPTLLGFPDGALGNYAADPTMLHRLTQQLQQPLQRLQPDALVTWGPDGGYGHPDHRLVNSIVAQLARAGAPGVPQRVFYYSIPEEGIRAMNPGRGAPPFLIPEARLFTVRIAFTLADFEAGRLSMACHKTQISDEALKRVTDSMRDVLKGELPFSPVVPQAAARDLFQ